MRIWRTRNLPVDGVPWLMAERLKVTGHTPEVVKARARQHEPKKALESIGITGRKHFAGFGAKEGSGVLIIDEASMVGEKMLALCQEAFPQICLVGDPGQLPPVQDKAMLAEVPGFELTEVHRQAKDSRIVQLAYAARYGEKFWESIPYVAGEVEEYTAVEAARFLEAPLVVWRNKTRLECTAAIRAALGYPTDALQVGEPLVCRSSDPRARSDGLYNNSLWRVVPPSVVVAAAGQPRLRDGAAGRQSGRRNARRARAHGRMPRRQYRPRRHSLSVWVLPDGPHGPGWRVAHGLYQQA